jgi:hypothetical protein
MATISWLGPLGRHVRSALDWHGWRRFGELPHRPIHCVRQQGGPIAETVLCLGEDNAGRLWVGTESAPLRGKLARLQKDLVVLMGERTRRPQTCHDPDRTDSGSSSMTAGLEQCTGAGGGEGLDQRVEAHILAKRTSSCQTFGTIRLGSGSGGPIRLQETGSGMPPRTSCSTCPWTRWWGR